MIHHISFLALGAGIVGNFNKNVIFGNDISIGSASGSAGSSVVASPAASPPAASPPVVTPIIAASRDRPARVYMNVAKSMTVTASSEYDTTTYAKENAADGYTSTEWSIDGSRFTTCAESVQLTLTAASPTRIDAFGFRSRDMVAISGDSYMTAIELVADGVSVAICDTQVTGSIVYNSHRFVVNCPLSAPLTATTFLIKGHTCVTGQYNNFGFRELILYQSAATPNPATIQTSQLPECAEITPVQLTWPPFELEVEMTNGERGDIWDVDKYLQGYEAFHKHPSGTWLCAVTASGALLFDETYLNAAGFGAFAPLFIGLSTLPSGRTFPNANVTSYEGSTYMTDLSTYCTELQQTPTGPALSGENKDTLVLICEVLYASTLQYRMEAYLASVEGAEGFNLPNGFVVSRDLAQRVLGDATFPPLSGENITVGPMTLQIPLSTYLYEKRFTELNAQGTFGPTGPFNKLWPALHSLPFTIFSNDAYTIWDGHSQIVYDGTKGSGTNLGDYWTWMGNAYYPKGFEICATSRLFVDTLAQTPSQLSHKKPLLCSGLVQKYLRGVSGMLELEKSLRYGSTDYATSAFGAEPAGALIEGGNPTLCDATHPDFLGPRWYDAYGNVGQQASMFPCAATLAAGDFSALGGGPGTVTATTDGFGLFGQNALTKENWFMWYDFHIKIHQLHIPPMNDYCESQPGNLMDAWKYTPYFQPWGSFGTTENSEQMLLGMGAAMGAGDMIRNLCYSGPIGNGTSLGRCGPMGPATPKVMLNKLYTWSSWQYFNTSWTTVNDVADNICDAPIHNCIRHSEMTEDDAFQRNVPYETCAMPGGPPYWFVGIYDDHVGLTVQKNQLNSIQQNAIM